MRTISQKRLGWENTSNTDPLETAGPAVGSVAPGANRSNFIAALRAFATRPAVISHLGDSGTRKMIATITITGTKPNAAVPRQPSAGNKIVTTKEASNRPTPAGMPILLVSRVRRASGVYSVINAN